jgi:hypothetical protein
MASVGWIDFSSEHRDKVRTVIDLLKKQGVVDELGIGVIRDSFADRLFPGVSTIQTRAKYFTLTALLIQKYLSQPEAKKEKVTLEDFLSSWEKWCRIKLASRYGSQGEARGIIGITFGERSDRDIQRPPSSVYWNGLRTFGIVRTGMSLSEFGRTVGGRRSLKSVLVGTDSLKGDDPDADGDSGPRVRVPIVHADYWNSLAITLSAGEAEFLRQHITASVPDTLLGQILLNDQATSQLLKLPRRTTFTDFADLPFIQQLMSADLRQALQHARDFWTIMEGAHIRYNCLLQGRFGTTVSKAECDKYWVEWRERIDNFDWNLWETSYVWKLVESSHDSRVQPATRSFVDGWIVQARIGCHDLAACDKLVINQELANKRNRARLRRGAKDEQVKEWIGLRELDYRFPQVRTLVEDIERGESGEADPDVGR